MHGHKYAIMIIQEEVQMNSLFKKLCNHEEKIAIIGLGYVGLPLAIAFAEKFDVIGYDLNERKIALYKNGIDPTKEIGNDAIKETGIFFTENENDLDAAKFYIIAVPTPVDSNHMPDLSPIENASHIIGRHLSPGSIVVYESTVYPGVTEEICIPILEEESQLECGSDFKVGYSPERINPGDKTHRLETITKVVSGIDDESLEEIASIYNLIIDAGVHRAESIKVAEAAKVIENSQRDVNIAFMNELSIIFHKMGIDTKAVLAAAKTKWNFLNFSPGLVGGHCIGVDPYYLTHKAEQLGYHSKIILSGRRINDDMGKYVAENLVKKLVANSVPVKGSNVAIFGLTFKENCSDIRNTRVIDIISELAEYGIAPLIYDPIASKNEISQLYGLQTCALSEITDMDALIIAVGHEEFKKFNIEQWAALFGNRGIAPIVLDVKGIFSKSDFQNAGFDYWRL